LFFTSNQARKLEENQSAPATSRDTIELREKKPMVTFNLDSYIDEVKTNGTEIRSLISYPNSQSQLSTRSNTTSTELNKYLFK